MQEFKFMSSVLYDNPFYEKNNNILQIPEKFYISDSEIPEISRRLATCGSARNYLNCFRSGSSSSSFSSSSFSSSPFPNSKARNMESDNILIQQEKKEKLCTACQDFCENENENDKKNEMISGFVGSGVFLQLQASGSSPSLGSLGLGIENRNYDWKKSWNQETCQSRHENEKPYQMFEKIPLF